MILFAILTGALKAIRDRDLWHSTDREDSDYTWLWGFDWYRRWSQTGAYWGPFPLDAWHNLDVACIASAVIAGGLGIPEYGFNAVWYILAVALPSKFLFYHILLMRNPMKELRNYFNEWTAR